MTSDKSAVCSRRPVSKGDWRKGKGRKALGLQAIGWHGFDISGKRRGTDLLYGTRKIIDLVKNSFPSV